MIELYQFSPKFSVPNLSPFCLKLETWLKMASLDYVVRHQDNPRMGPLGKLPYIKDDNTVLADSTLIIEYLKNKYNIHLDAHLDSQQNALAHACQSMVEEHLYWALVYHRWLGEGWPQLKAHVLRSFPPVVRHLVPMLIQTQLKRDLHGQGLGRHSVEQINEFARKDLESLSQLLGDKTYMLGEQLSSVDATVFAILCELLHSSLSTPLKAVAESYPNLVRYEQHMGKRFYPEYYA